MSNNVKTSFGFIARDKFSWAPQSLAGLVANVSAQDEVLVMDSGYAPDTRQHLEQIAATAICRVDFVMLPEFANTNLAWNQFVRNAAGDILTCLENDVVPQLGCMETRLRY